MSTADQVVSRLNRASQIMARAQTEALKQAAAKARSTMLHVPRVPRVVAKRPVDVRTKLVDPHTVSLKWTPNTVLVDQATSSHFIGPRGKGRGSLRRQNTIRGSRRAQTMAIASLFGGTVGAGGKGAINIPGVGPRAWALHPGTKGKHFVEVGKVLARPIATQTFGDKLVTESLKSALHG